MPTIEKAIMIAATCHAGQKDKGGAPYILHPLAVMARVSSETEKIVALLHDVLEDTPMTIDELKMQGFSSEILNALDALTKREGETRLQAAIRAKSNPIACVVKIADVSENMNLERIPNPTPKDYARLKEYESVIRLLQAESISS